MAITPSHPIHVKSVFFALAIIIAAIAFIFIFKSTSGSETSDIRSRASDEAEQVVDSPAVLTSSDKAVESVDTYSLDAEIQSLEATK